MAQLVVRLVRDQEVAGSSPAVPTISNETPFLMAGSFSSLYSWSA